VRRRALVAAVFAFALGCGSASAHHAASTARISARLIPPAGGIVAGRPATASLTVMRGSRPVRGAAPRVRFVSGAIRITATARPAGKAGRYSLRLRLPQPGVWTYRITIGRAVAGSGRINARVDARLPGADAYSICADAGSSWPARTLAIDFGAAWIVCKERGRLARFDLASARTVTVVQLDGSGLTAVTTGFGSVWTLQESGRLTRIDPGGNVIAARIDLGTGRANNVWAGAGAVWVADDATGQLIRIDPSTNAIVARIPVGDGSAALIFQGTTGWLIVHRDRGLVQLDTQGNTARRLATIPGNGPERLVWSAGHLWATGRATDLLELDPNTGSVLRVVEIGPGAIDVVAWGDTLWVAAHDSATLSRGFATLEALRRVDAQSGTVTASTAVTGRLDVHGLVADERGIWLADNTSGVLYRVPR
jgi:hypothetical protein